MQRNRLVFFIGISGLLACTACENKNPSALESLPITVKGVDLRGAETRPGDLYNSLDAKPQKKGRPTQMTIEEIDEEVARLKTVQAPFYSPLGKQDPFWPRESKDESKEKKLATDYELDSFHILGVFAGHTFSKAMVQAPDGAGFIMKEGDFLGNKGGKIFKIDVDSLVVREKIKGADDKIYFLEHTLKMFKKGN